MNPPDLELAPVSRTVGDSSVVDEFILRFTHTTVMDWMLPGIEPTGRAVEVPMVAIVAFTGDKLSHEHIYWDQASVLAATRLARGRRSSDRRRRDRAQGARQRPAQQYSDPVSTGGIILVALAIAVGIVGIIVPLLPGILLVYAAILIWAFVVHNVAGWVTLGVVTVLSARPR